MQLAIILGYYKTIMKWVKFAWWKEVDRSDALNSFISIYLYNVDAILQRNMNCHTESIFTGHFIYRCLKVYAGKSRLFKCLEVDIVSP